MRNTALMKRVATLLALTATGVLTTAVTTAAAPAGALDSVGTATGVTENTADLVLEVNEVARDSSGSYVTLVWSVRNEGTERTSVRVNDTTMGFDRSSFSGVTLRDEASRTRFHPGMNEDTACLCSRDSSGTIKARLEPGAEVAYWSLYAVPAEVESVTVEVPDFGDVSDIPLT